MTAGLPDWRAASTRQVQERGDRAPRRVASGVRSRGPRPVPPVVTTRPWKFIVRSFNAATTESTPSSTTFCSVTEKFALASRSASAGAARSTAAPRGRESETVRIFAACVTNSDATETARARTTCAASGDDERGSSLGSLRARGNATGPAGRAERLGCRARPIGLLPTLRSSTSTERV